MNEEYILHIQGMTLQTNRKGTMGSPLSPFLEDPEVRARVHMFETHHLAELRIRHVVIGDMGRTDFY